MGFGDNLKQIRRERNVTQEQLAEILGVSRQAVSKWESGFGYPETEKLIDISQKLNISIDVLLDNKPVAESKDKDTVVRNTFSGKIAIATYDNEKVVMCQSVKSSKIAFHGDGPSHILFGVDSVTFWGEHTTLLGWYSSEESIQKEIFDISEAIACGQSKYSLKYNANVVLKGIFGRAVIVDDK